MEQTSPVIAHGRAVPVLHNATLPDGRVVDVHLERGRVREVVPAAGRSAVGDELDLTGHLLLTAPAEPHAHLDKALSFDEIRPPMGDLGAAIAAWENHTPTLTVEGIAERARRAALLLLGNGTTAVRSHVNLLRGDDPLRGIRALVEVRADLASVMDIQIVAMAPYFAEDAAVLAALDLGADLVGGHPHQTPDPSGNLQRLLAIARYRNVGVDMHTDEQLNPMMLTLEELARSVRDWPKSMPVTAGHCVSLGMVQADVLDRVIRAVKDSDVGIVSLPITNLYLQGWADPVATPRGLTAVRALLDAGVRVAGGADNVRDPYNPLGRSDALETAMLLVTAAHLPVDEAYRAVSEGARDIMGLPVAGVAAGLSADLLAIRSSSLEEAVAAAPQDRIVLSRGRFVSVTRTNRSCVAMS
ncbi:amidohydrolase family protein [Mycolicibacterium septicum]|uniref:amidohydrolase family protein n=1 Tax=Mycolicibacterium septicum TaxID=98668 RepID=UPI0023E175DD|nr:amidohydrolase family protein [Mycolicibacterium septicum]MDF3337265.1 amidohydrolase family protein [Mycolicibacterium septicum]